MTPGIEQKIVEIAERLGFEAARVWPGIVAITWMNAVFWTVAIPVLLLIVLTALALFWLRLVLPEHRVYLEERRQILAKDDGRYYREPSAPEGWYFTGAIVTAVAFVLCGAGLQLWPGHFAAALNPEAATVLKLLGR